MMVRPAMPEVRLVYFEDCPHWRTADSRLKEALIGAGADPVRVVYQQVTTAEDAEASGFGGSPTILVDGADPFARPDDPMGLSCRLYRSAAGSEPAPTVEQLRAVLNL